MVALLGAEGGQAFGVRLSDLALAEFFELDDARLWLFAPHPQLNGERPANLVPKGRQKEVLAVIARPRCAN
jgi:uncharacterized protein (DUF2384 family)